VRHRAHKCKREAQRTSFVARALGGPAAEGVGLKDAQIRAAAAADELEAARQAQAEVAAVAKAADHVAAEAAVEQAADWVVITETGRIVELMKAAREAEAALAEQRYALRWWLSKSLKRPPVGRLPDRLERVGSRNVDVSRRARCRPAGRAGDDGAAEQHGEGGLGRLALGRAVGGVAARALGERRRAGTGDVMEVD